MASNPTQPQGTDQQTFNNELRGALFRNDKGDNPARPDYRGRCQLAGIGYRISGWVRTSQAGQNFLSLAFTEDPKATPPDPTGHADTGDDPLPF